MDEKNKIQNAALNKSHSAYIWFKILDEYLVWIFIILILAAMLVTTRNFLRPVNLNIILINAAPMGILTIAASFALLVGKFDLSIESNMGFCAMIGALLVTKAGLNPFLSIILLLAAGAAIGLFNGLCIVKLGVNPFLQTLAMLILLRGLIIFITSGVTIANLPDRYRVLGNEKVLGIPVQIVLLILLYIIFSIVLENTVFGKRLYAIGANSDLAFESGIKTNLLNISVFIIGGVLAAFAGLILSSKQGVVNAGLGKGMLFTVFAAAVLGGVSLKGGKGRLIGAFGGVLFLNIIASLLSWFEVSAFAIDSFTGGLILFAIILDSLKNKIRDLIIF